MIDRIRQQKKIFNIEGMTPDAKKEKVKEEKQKEILQILPKAIHTQDPCYQNQEELK